MNRRQFQPLLVHARRSEDGKTRVLQVVNWDDAPRPSRVSINGFAPSRPLAIVEVLAGPLEAANTAAQPDRIQPHRSVWKHAMTGGKAIDPFPPRSITMIRLD